jgi:hypothetical protein
MSSIEVLNSLKLKINNSLKEFQEITPDSPDTKSIQKDLESDLTKLETVLKSIQSLQKNRLSDTISLPTKKSPSSPHEDKKSSFQSTKKPKTHPTLESPSILQDPEILALITKNRKLLMRQKTSS